MTRTNARIIWGSADKICGDGEGFSNLDGWWVCCTDVDDPEVQLVESIADGARREGVAALVEAVEAEVASGVTDLAPYGACDVPVIEFDTVIGQITIAGGRIVEWCAL